MPDAFDYNGLGTGISNYLAAMISSGVDFVQSDCEPTSQTFDEDKLVSVTSLLIDVKSDLTKGPLSEGRRTATYALSIKANSPSKDTAIEDVEDTWGVIEVAINNSGEEPFVGYFDGGDEYCLLWAHARQFTRVAADLAGCFVDVEIQGG